MHPESVQKPSSVTGRDGLQRLINLLAAADYQVIVPRFDGVAIALGPVARVEDMPIGIADEQEAGRYRTEGGNGGSVFGFVLPAQGWKRYIYPSAELLLRARRQGNGFAVDDHPHVTARSTPFSACAPAISRASESWTGRCDAPRPVSAHRWAPGRACAAIMISP